MAEMPLLLPHHLEQLTKGSGIAPEVIAERGYRSISGPGGTPSPRAWAFRASKRSRRRAYSSPSWD
jgi:hypothetical protein